MGLFDVEMFCVSRVTCQNLDKSLKRANFEKGRTFGTQFWNF